MIHTCENTDCNLPFHRLTKKEKYCQRCRRSGVAYYKPADTIVKKCPTCSESFKTNYSRKVYCSKQCREAADTRGNPEVTKKCEYCGTAFKTTDTRKKYCGTEHYLKAKALRSNSNGNDINKV